MDGSAGRHVQKEKQPGNVYKQHLNIYRIKSRVSRLFPPFPLRDYLYPTTTTTVCSCRLSLSLSDYWWKAIPHRILWSRGVSFLLGRHLREIRHMRKITGYDEANWTTDGLVVSDRGVITINLTEKTVPIVWEHPTKGRADSKKEKEKLPHSIVERLVQLGSSSPLLFPFTGRINSI